MTPESYRKSRVNWQYLYSRHLELSASWTVVVWRRASHSTVVAWLASEGIGVGFAHWVSAVPTQACENVIAMVAASAANEDVIFSITNRLYCGGEVKREKTSPFFEVTFVPVHFDEFSCSIHKRGSQHRVNG